jgi:7-keto-8-aminopelargonate synthetase-like enzyme
VSRTGLTPSWQRSDLGCVGVATREGSASPVIPVRFPDQLSMLSAQRLLVEHGVYTHAVLPPAGESHQLRIACTGAHTPDVLEAAIGVFASLREDLLPRYRRAA